MLTQSNADGTTTWEYDTKPFGKGLLSKVTYNNTMQEYWHDNLSRLTKTVETVDARTFEENYTYDAYSRLEKQIYPDNFTIIHSYLNGQLYEVKNFANNESIWKAQSQDVYGNYDKYLSGNSLLTEITRDNTNGHITDIKSGQNNPIQWWHYTYDDNNNLESRSDYVSGQNEYFTYDSDNRLTNVGYNTDINHTLLPLLIMDYDFRGNITTKSDAGGYLYEDPNKPNQLSKLTNYNPASTPEHFLQYFINGKTKKIEQGNQIIDFTYGADAMRVKTIFNDNGIIHTKYFALGDYEEEVVNGVAAKYYYIAGGDGLAAIYKQVGTAAGTMYYVHKDLLGSIDLLTTKVNGVVQVAERYAYDAWGNRRAPANWTLPDTRTAWIIVRGYIGQEHLNILGLINLNGRIFEPRTARFLSADDFVSAPDFSQAYNRYAYCVNNPLRYTDPNGEFWNLVIGALVGGVMNWAMNGAEFTWRGLGYFGIGTVSGSLGAGIGGGISSMIMGSSFGAGFIGSSLAMAAPSCFLTGAAIGGSAGLAGSFVNGFGNGLMGGQSFGNALVSSLQSGIIGGVSGAILAGIVGGIRAESKGMSFWTGGEKPKVYYSPVEDNIGRADAQCALRCLEECSESYGMKQYDYEKWLGLNGGNSAVDANSLESLIDGTKIFSSDPVTPDPQEIANAFSSDKRVILAITTEKGSAHAVMVSKVKIWPSGKYSVWFAETSPVRYTPYSTSDFFELNGPRFWSFYLSK
jgi:RHS repeat-associated protein